MLTKCKKYIFAGLAIGTLAVHPVEEARSADFAWKPIGDYDLYLRNNSTTSIAVTEIALETSSQSGCTYDIHYTNVKAIPGGATTEILDTDGDCPSVIWRITLSLGGKSKTIYFKGNGSMARVKPTSNLKA